MTVQRKIRTTRPTTKLDLIRAVEMVECTLESHFLSDFLNSPRATDIASFFVPFIRNLFDQNIRGQIQKTQNGGWHEINENLGILQPR